ncbi:MAG: class I SAM-dependent methyltransferase [Candidatus Eremiobacteraeota bacterium]|nr:class I SAM-dependent methyltransferase [Candidatus Eremiobacteraeota bacterium]
MAAGTKSWYDAHYAAETRVLTPWYSGMLEWIRKNHPAGPIVELGCGSALLLERLQAEALYSESELYGLEQSSAAVAAVAGKLPNVTTGDIEAPLPYADASVGVVVLAEVIEHLIRPWELLAQIRRILRPGGLLLLSFPNYLHAPWLLLRILADLFDQPSWIILQPVDRMYTTPLIKKRLRERGFAIGAIIGNTYGPPKLHEWEPRWLRAILNAAGLAEFSFHPVLVCEKV